MYIVRYFTCFRLQTLVVAEEQCSWRLLTNYLSSLLVGFSAWSSLNSHTLRTFITHSNTSSIIHRLLLWWHWWLQKQLRFENGIVNAVHCIYYQCLCICKDVCLCVCVFDYSRLAVTLRIAQLSTHAANSMFPLLLLRYGIEYCSVNSEYFLKNNE